ACVKLTQRYIADRFLPDKAIDALDEAGSRVHITNIEVPESIKELELELEHIMQEKVRVVKSQRYEEAAKLRDDEKKIQAKLETAKSAWEDSIKLNKKLVDEEQVAEVVAMMTGVPVQRVAAMMMGVWFLSSAFAAYVAGWIAGLMAIQGQGASSDPVGSLAIYMGVFEKLGYFAVVVAIVLWILSPRIHRAMHEGARLDHNAA
ncbi:MAG: hypothetical protein EBY55_05190, partial [Gammaproteobacteria bacterium]|nr:hypothetical protein [Gammaproteobacteria bacterium]